MGEVHAHHHGVGSGNVSGLTDFSWYDDQLIYTVTTTEGASRTNNIMLTNITTDTTITLTEGKHPTWSPDGTQIAYTSRRVSDSGEWDIYLANADGTDKNVISMDSEFVLTSPIWSLDGAHISYLENVTDQWGGLVQQNIYLTLK